MRSRLTLAAASLAILPSVVCQTFTTCDPIKKTCPDDPGLNADSLDADFTHGSGAISSFSAAAYTTLTYGDNGAEFTIAKQGQAPTIQSNFYIFFGMISVTMRAAPGTGIVSSVVLQSDDLDEIDWEWLGGNSATVETNYFGKGNTTVYDRAIYYPVSDPQDNFHTYAIDWTADRIKWIIDGTVVRTLQYGDANEGKNYPQTPMILKMGNWAGGGEGQPEGTIEWAGGKTDFSKAPFTMYVKNVQITNYYPASSYSFTDESGRWQSIKVNTDASSGSNSSNMTMSSSTSSPSTTASVAPLDQNTGAAVAVTSTGESYSVNTASVSALNSGSAVVATTQVPAATASRSPTHSGSQSTQTGSSGAGRLGIGALTLLITVGLGFWVL
nr:hypothetical protein B0A51_09044 [Rachicladosporium sp. CCFEE 5018]